MSNLSEKTEIVAHNRLVSLKVLVFFFFGALQCMYVFLPSHMKDLGFTLYDIRLVTLISGLVSIIGPLIVGIILDRLTIRQPSAYGKWLRILLFIFFLLAGIMFGSLLFVPAASGPSDESSATFSCNSRGGYVYINKNITDNNCINLEGRSGELHLYNCTYTCESPENFRYLNKETQLFKTNPEKRNDFTHDALTSNSTENVSTDDPDYLEASPLSEEASSLPEAAPLIQAPPQLIPPPHVCLNKNNDGTCYVYLEGNYINLKNIQGAKSNDDQTTRFNDEFCSHPLENFSCDVPKEQVTWMEIIRRKDNLTDCTPAVECLIDDPYSGESVLRYVERTEQYKGRQVPYDLYFTLRIIAEIFPVIIHMLLNIAIIIATRETSVGRGNVGHLWVFYPIGVLVFTSVVGLINHTFEYVSYFVPILFFSISMLICAIVVLLSGKLPLTPSDWWWHTKCGMLAIPMSALKRYKWVIAAIATVSLVLGGLWHIQEAYRDLYTVDMIEYAIVGNGTTWKDKTPAIESKIDTSIENPEFNNETYVSNTTNDATKEESKNMTLAIYIIENEIINDYPWRSKSFVYIIGAVLAIPLIWNGEKIVDFLGHSNIFILAFVSFALRFAGLYFDCTTILTTLYEIMEPLSFYLPWLALFLFSRHLIPKKLLAIGQGLLVILFFALGRAIGFFYGTSIIADDRNNSIIWQNPLNNMKAELNDLMTIYTVAATIACISAIIYFTIYHCILLPYYHVPTNRLATNNDTNVSPQRVFHDERSRKGYFRY